MGVNSPEGNLDLSSGFVPRNISDFLTDLSMIDDVSKKVKKLNDYVHVLEDELRKIDAFKRELPLCMLLLNDAIERLKEERVHCMKTEARPLMEEFIPLMGGNSNEDGGVKKSSDCSDKKNWMSSAQLWSTNVQYENFDIKKQDSVSDLESREKEEDGLASENTHQLCKFRNSGGGAFVPFKGQSGLLMNEKNKVLLVNGLSLSVPTVEMGSINIISKNSVGSSLMTDSQRQADQQLRKSRRCWSPELHRRFVHALQQLGGPQLATPKQIRELMQVGDLTNDEVKSHLQKYRLHVRKLPASSAVPSNCSWLARDRYGDVSKAQAGSPEGPLHLNGSAKGVSITGGNSAEDGEDEKSESHNWKGWFHKPVEDHV